MLKRHLLSIALVVLFLFAPLTVLADTFESLLMPGPLIEGHAKYEEECNKCHKVLGKKADENQQCLDCHKEIRRDVSAKQGFHGRNKQVRGQHCRTCHTEHKGRDADIIKLNPVTFDHQFTDFVLRGTHAKTNCNSCHKKGKKFREAPTACANCHKDDDPHKGRLGEYEKKCAMCHKESGWTAIRFDHNKRTKFKLTGKHAKTACVNCHQNDRYVKTPKDCYSCHRIDDIHRGGNGKKCQKCHSTTSWKKLGFNHDKETDFPLTGRHKGAKCQSCHKKDPYKYKLKTNCVSCHKQDDKHKGHNGSRCENCHKTSGWEHSRFNHDRDTKFKLRGKHKQALCTSCHKGDIEKRKTSRECYSCHKVDDVHRGQQGKQCQRCHNENGWHQKVRFDHDLTRFPLLGLHAVTPCEECHLSATYQDTKRSCYACHKVDDEHKQRLGTQCEQCHNPNGWKLWRFDHNTQSQFKLEGKHAKVHCHSCHRSKVDKVESHPRPCAACHGADDAHNGQFGSNCDRCHNTRSFFEVDIKR